MLIDWEWGPPKPRLGMGRDCFPKETLGSFTRKEEDGQPKANVHFNVIIYMVIFL